MSNETAKFINDYSDKYKSLPTVDQIKATTGVELKNNADLSEHNEWFINEWIHLVSVHPSTRELSRFYQGSFVSIDLNFLRSCPNVATLLLSIGQQFDAL